MPTPEFKVGHKIVTLVIRFKNSITPHRKGDEPVNDPINDANLGANKALSTKNGANEMRLIRLLIVHTGQFVEL